MQAFILHAFLRDGWYGNLTHVLHNLLLTKITVSCGYSFTDPRSTRLNKPCQVPVLHCALTSLEQPIPVRRATQYGCEVQGTIGIETASTAEDGLLVHSIYEARPDLHPFRSLPVFSSFADSNAPGRVYQMYGVSSIKPWY